MNRSLLDALPRWLLTWLVCLALNLGLGVLLNAGSRWWLAALVLLFWCGLLAAAERFGRFWAMLALWIAALGLCLLLEDRKLLAEAVLAFFSRSGGSNRCSGLALLLLCASAALPLAAALRCYWVRAALSLGWGALWLAGALLGWPIPRLLPAALIPLLLLTLAETVRRLRHGPEPAEPLKRALLLALLPAALLLAVLPTSAEPYDYPLLHSVKEKIEDLWRGAETALHYRNEGDRQFGLSFNGVSDDAGLSGAGAEENAAAVYVKPDQTPYGTVYLFGNAWDTFDGRGWRSALKPEDAKLLNWSIDTAEHLYAFWRMMGAEGGPALFSDYFRPNSVYLSCRSTNVRTMFTVMNATHLFTDTDRYPFADAPTGSLFDYVQKEEVWYRVHFLESNARMRRRLIAFAEGTPYDTEAHTPRWSQVAEDIYGLRLDVPDGLNLERTFGEREALIRRVYLDSSSVSARAGALAGEITAGCGSDSEKVAAIAAYLQQNYRYTLSPEPVPAGEDFLDWLLFEGQEGFCTWYATAAVLLSRSVGVPARFVQGYRADLTGGGFTKLGSGDAHAWCECYIAGYGWVTVEATPGFGGSELGWLTAEERDEALDVLPPSLAESEAEPPSGADRPDPDEPLLPPDLPGQGKAGTASASEPDAGPAPFRWVPALFFAGLPAAVLLWLRARRKRRYAKASPSGRLMMDLERLLRDLRGKGYPRRPEEPLRQYFERLPWHNLLAGREEAEALAALYDRCLFSQAVPSAEELEKSRAFAARFRPRTLQQWLLWLRLQ